MAARAAMLGLCVGLSLIRGDVGRPVAGLLALLAIATLATLAATRPAVAPWTPVVEPPWPPLVIGFTSPFDSVALPYLLVPALEAGLLSGLPTVVLHGRGGRLRAGDRPARLRAGGGRARLHLHRRPVGRPGPRGRLGRRLGAPDPAAGGRRLDDRLLRGGVPPAVPAARGRAGSCPAAWTPVTLGQVLLESLRSTRALHPSRRVRALRGRPPGAAGLRRGRAGSTGCPTLDDDSAWAEAWSSGIPRRQQGPSPTAPGGYAAVLPLRVGVRVVGLVGLERLEAPFTEDQLRQAAELVDEASLRLETALLFAEVRRSPRPRSAAGWPGRSTTASPRSWRSLGYVVDDIAYRARTSQQRERTCRPARRADPDHHRAAAVDLRPAQRGAARPRASARRCPTTSARSGADVGPDRPPGARRVAAAGCGSRPRPSCCGSPRRRSPTPASTPVRGTCG